MASVLGAVAAVAIIMVALRAVWFLFKSPPVAEGPPAIPEEDSDRTCRICCAPDATDPYQPLVAPCSCRGSVRWVHVDCFLEWLCVSKKMSCEVCLQPYESDNLGWSRLFLAQAACTVTYWLSTAFVGHYVLHRVSQLWLLSPGLLVLPEGVQHGGVGVHRLGILLAVFLFSWPYFDPVVWMRSLAGLLRAALVLLLSVAWLYCPLLLAAYCAAGHLTLGLVSLLLCRLLKVECYDPLAKTYGILCLLVTGGHWAALWTTAFRCFCLQSRSFGIIVWMQNGMSCAAVPV